MLENIKGFCCHYGGFCEKENFIKTTYIYNKISKQICIAICILLFYCPGQSMRTTPSFSESTKILEVAGNPHSLRISTGMQNFINWSFAENKSYCCVQCLLLMLPARTDFNSSFHTAFHIFSKLILLWIFPIS